jgi:hypothetical protein
MALADILQEFDAVTYGPRTLRLHIPEELTSRLSVSTRAFLNIAFGESGFTVLDVASNSWTTKRAARLYYFSCDDEERAEILAFLTLFVHEYTHRVDFLISPFGLHYYVNSLREYLVLQQFFPRLLDDSESIKYLRFLAAFDESGYPVIESDVRELWEPLNDIIRTFYAWGDVSGVKPLGKYVAAGWGSTVLGARDPFGVGVALEPVTVLNCFETFRKPGSDDFWYLRPLTIFETKAVVNSLLFVLDLFKEGGLEECANYYEKVYLVRRERLADDYFFLLDIAARIYGRPDFATLLRNGPLPMARSILLTLSGICWYALQAPPPLKGQDGRIANPVFRLMVAFNFMRAALRGESDFQFQSIADGLSLLDKSQSGLPYCLPIADVLSTCNRVLAHATQRNRETWHPDVRAHFEHIFAIMRPHFSGREATHVSWLGMPENGNPIAACRSQDDWELTYDDYEVPAGVSQWFDVRTDLFFNMLAPPEEVIGQLQTHFQAFLLPYRCECGQGITSIWVSRFARTYRLTCAFCNETTSIVRDEFRMIAI